MNENSPEPKPFPRRFWRMGFLAAALVISTLAVIFLYGNHGPGRQLASICLDSKQRWQTLDPLVHGEIAALSLAREPEPLPSLSFTAADGQTKTLVDFKGKALLVNLWATWCVPCRQEMPSLDKLQEALGSKDFQVVAINIDTAKLDRPKAFLDEIGVKNLAFYADPTTSVFQNLKAAGKALGLPTTVLVDKQGCEIGTMAGPAQWDGPEAMALIKTINSQGS